MTYKILDLIPQRPPMVMIDMLLEVTETSAVTGFEVKTENLFVQNDQLQATALMENIAQTAAAHAGYWARQRNSPPAVGFIGAIKDFKLHRLPKVGETLRTEFQVVSEVLNFSVVKGCISIHQETIAEAELKIFLQATPTTTTE